MRKLGLAYHELFTKHDAGPDHPECPERIFSIMKAISTQSWRDAIEQVEARAAEVSETALVHSEEYIDKMRELCEDGGQYLPSMESNVGSSSYPAAMRAVGAGLTLADGIMSGKWSLGFAPTRPPGHHACKDRPMGLCIFCSIGVTAKYILQKYDIQRIAIVDFDIHHGNGSEETFWEEDRVLYCSLHRDNHFPYDKGMTTHKGTGRGEGYTLNVPLVKGCDDETYLKAFDEKVFPKVAEFAPEIILVSAGFDGHYRDMIGGMNLTGNLYSNLAKRLLRLAEESAQGRILTLLEGGYDEQGLIEGVIKYLGTLVNDDG